MAAAHKGFSSIGFTKTFILPGLLVFLVPVLSLFFFWHAQSRFNAQAKESILKDIQSDRTLTAEEREKAVKFFNEVPFSRLVRQKPFSDMVTPEGRFNFATFRWMILLSLATIASGIAVFLIGGVCVALSFTSQRIQYLTLLIGWHVLRIYSALQTAAQGVMLFALSYWVTVLWFNMYVPKLIFVVGFMAVAAVFVVIAGIFKRVKTDQILEGVIIDKQTPSLLWNELNAICEKVGTEPPDQIILGIDDNFFVTEMPVIVNGNKLKGRTLYLSLALLKQLSGGEAEAVLAHEMAHYSGHDTMYSKKIAPLLNRYAIYLNALLTGGVTLPAFYFMNCFRAMYEISLGRMSRQREFRADRIASEVASPINFAQGLMRIVAYSSFRNEVQEELFKQERAMEQANICEQIETGFHNYALAFASKPEIGELESAHPFDTHPAISQRLETLGIPFERAYVEQLLSAPGDGRWYHCIEDAGGIEGRQWEELEKRFRDLHEQSLPYRFIPETDEERDIVVKSFPEGKIEEKNVWFTFNYEGVQFQDWADPVKFSEFSSCGLNEGILTIHFQREGKKQNRTAKMKKFGKQQQGVIDLINKYYGRYVNAVAYQEQKKVMAAVAAANAN